MNKKMIGRIGLILFLLGGFLGLSQNPLSHSIASLSSILLSLGGSVYILFGEDK